MVCVECLRGGRQFFWVQCVGLMTGRSLPSGKSCTNYLMNLGFRATSFIPMSLVVWERLTPIIKCTVLDGLIMLGYLAAIICPDFFVLRNVFCEALRWCEICAFSPFFEVFEVFGCFYVELLQDSC